MSLITQPIQDLSLGSWGPSPLWERISEYIVDDSTYIQGPTSGTSSCELRCYAISDPQCSWGHRVSYRYCRKGTGSGSVNLTVALKVGSTTIATWTHANIGPTVVEVEQTLTEAQADAISYYGDLRLRFTHTTVSGSGYSAAVTWALIETPEVGEEGSVSVAPTARAAAGAKVDPRVVLGDLVLSPAAAITPCKTQIFCIASPSDLLVVPGQPASAGCATTFQFLIAPGPPSCRACVVDPTLVMSSLTCAPGTPAAAVVASAAPAYIVINAVVVELDLKNRTVALLTLGERPGVYLVERWALEDGSGGHWLFADGDGIELGIGLAGTQFNLWPRSLRLSIEHEREE